MSATTSAGPVGAATPWASGRFDGRPGGPRLLFGRSFEDPAIELGLFPPAGDVLCIAGAGDVAAALSAAGHTVTAVDVNPAQIVEAGRRLAQRPARAGVADRLLALGRAALAPAGWHPSRLAAFCRLDDLDEQRREWQRLASPAVRVAVRIGLARPVLRSVYGEAFVRTVPRRFGDELLDRVGRRVASAPNRDNPWLALLLTGRWPAVATASGSAVTATSSASASASAPAPMTRPGAVALRLGDVLRVLDSWPTDALDAITLSNVLDGPGWDYRRRLLTEARRAARPGAPIVVRSFATSTHSAARALADRDRSLLWGAVAVHRGEGRV